MHVGQARLTANEKEGGGAGSALPSMFECLEDVDDKSQTSEPCQAMDNKSFFSQRLQVADDNDDDEMPPFVLPVQGQANDGHKDMLEVVIEEDEDELIVNFNDLKVDTTL